MTRKAQHTRKRRRKIPRLISCLFSVVCTIIILLPISVYRKLAVQHTADDIVYNGYFGKSVIGTTNKKPRNIIQRILNTYGPTVKKEPKHFKIRPGTTSITNENTVNRLGLFMAAHSIELPDSLITIDEAAFKNTVGLKSIVIPNSVTFIGNNGFQSCFDLKSITLSNNLTAIPDYCFSKCKALESISIPNSVNRIGFPSAPLSTASA